MSYTVTIKEEISNIKSTKSEMIAELSGFVRNNATFIDGSLSLTTEAPFGSPLVLPKLIQVALTLLIVTTSKELSTVIPSIIALHFHNFNIIIFCVLVAFTKLPFDTFFTLIIRTIPCVNYRIHYLFSFTFGICKLKSQG